MATIPLATSQDLDVRSNLPDVVKLFRRGPQATYYHLRDAIGGMAGSHRREWLQRTEVAMNRGGFAATAIKPNPTVSGFAGRFFYYRVGPGTRPTRPKEPRLSDITLELYSTSEVALAQEQGATIRPRTGRMLAIPIGVSLRKDGRPIPRWHTPRAYRQSAANNDLVALNLAGNPKLYQVRRGVAAARKSGAFSRVGEGAKPARARTVLLPAYQLAKQVQLKPRLRFMATWDALQDDRKVRFARAASRILEEIANAK